MRTILRAPTGAIGWKPMFGGVSVDFQYDINPFRLLIRAVSKIPMSVNRNITSTIRSA
jgi:hypothetical protein